MAGLVLAIWTVTTAQAAPEDTKSTGSSVTEEKEIERLQKRIRQLEESLALANTEADTFHQRWIELRLKVEALGIEAITTSEKALEEKVIRLLGELYRSEKSKIALEQAAVRFMEAWKASQLAGPLQRVQRRADLEVARRELLKLIAPNEADEAIASDLNSGSVVLYDDELNVAIINFGRAQGARPGIPFRILRNNQVIGRCRLVEVREYISAARILDTLKKTTVQKGDRLLLETVK
jgi:hypothetical protein